MSAEPGRAPAETRRQARVFLALWAGQLVSQLGSGLTTFALGVWVYQRTGSTTEYVLIAFSGTLPSILLLPVAGALVDRHDRRTVMLLADIVAAMMPALLALLLFTGHLTLGAIYAAVAGGAIAGAFRWPAYSAAVSVLVPKEQLGRAGGMVQMTDAAAQLVCPIVAGALVSRVGIKGILLLDAATFVVSLASLAAVRIPRAAPSEPPAPAGERALFGEMSFGWSYLRARPGLLGLLVFFAVCNLLDGIAMVLATPMILALASPAELGAALTIGASGMLLGTLVMSAWGGPRRRVAAMLGGEALSGAAIAAAGLARTLPGITAAAFALCFFNAIINVLSQALFQSKVAHDVQGRVFAVRRMIALSSQPLVFLLAGPLADRVFEPLLAPGGALGSSVGHVVGVGPGRGIAFLFVVLGAGIVAVAFGARLAPRLCRVEEELPDAT